MPGRAGMHDPGLPLPQPTAKQAGEVADCKGRHTGVVDGLGPKSKHPGRHEPMKLRTLLAVAAAAATMGATAVSAQQHKQMSIVTGGTGGVYYPLGGGFGNILGKELAGVTATAQVTGGSVANLQLIGSGKADIALHPGGRGLGRRQRPGQVRQRQAADPGPRRHVPQPHARDLGGWHRHHQGRGHEGQTRLHGLARQRHRGLRDARDRGGRPRPAKRTCAASAWARRRASTR